MSKGKMHDLHQLPVSKYIFHQLRDERLGMEGDAVCLGKQIFEEVFEVEKRGDGGLGWEDDGIFDQLQSSAWGEYAIDFFEYVCP